LNSNANQSKFIFFVQYFFSADLKLI